MVWSSAARKSASATPTVARIRAFRVISAGIGGLLGHGIDRLIEIRQRGAQTYSLVSGDACEQGGHAPLHDLAVLVELAASLSGQLDEHDPPISRILETPNETLTPERVDELRERRGRHRAALREIATTHRAPAKLPHDPSAVRRHVGQLAARGRGHL